mmetsp:Transcript_23535/g.79799  ORF Transcript_23535/g.79799 Transcript_23535/m.79799 type:complete len:172 (+) Transcript_23535:185-700(+)
MSLPDSSLNDLSCAAAASAAASTPRGRAAGVADLLRELVPQDAERFRSTLRQSASAALPRLPPSRGEALPGPSEPWPYAEPSGDFDRGEVRLPVPELPEPPLSLEGADVLMCNVCEQRFSDVLLLLQHQVDRGHCNAELSQDLEALRGSDRAALGDATKRLQDALGDLDFE